MQTGPDLPVGYIDLKPRAADSRGPPVNCGTHRESVACILSVRLVFVKILCLNYSWSGHMPTTVLMYSMHVGCVLYLLNGTDCHV